METAHEYLRNRIKFDRDQAETYRRSAAGLRTSADENERRAAELDARAAEFQAILDHKPLPTAN